MKLRYTVHSIEETTVWKHTEGEDSNHYTDTDVSEKVIVDVEDAYAALCSDNWDALDIRSEEVLCYPADGHENFRTGDFTRTTVVVCGSESAISALMDYYFRKAAKDAKSRNQ